MSVFERDNKTGVFPQGHIDRSGWETVQLGELGCFFKGIPFSKTDLSETGQYRAIHYGQLFTSYGPFIECVLSRSNIGPATGQKGDLLFPASDVTPDGLGRCSALLDNDVVLGGDILVLRPLEGVDPRFLSLVVNKEKRQIIERVTGTTIKHISAKALSSIEIAIPSFPDQQRIAAAFCSVETHLEHLSALLSKQVALKKATLSLLMKPSNDWTSCEFREVCVPVQWHRQQIIPKRKKLVSVVTQGDDSEKQAISANRYFSIKEPLILFGDHTCLVKLLTTDCRIEGDGVKLFAPKDCDPVFLFHSIQMNASTIPIGYARHLNALRETPVCMPSLFEQRRIAATLATIDESIARIKAEWEKMSALKAGLMRYYFG